MTNAFKGSLSEKRDESVSLPSILKTPESAELVSDMGQQPACDIIEALAGEWPSCSCMQANLQESQGAPIQLVKSVLEQMHVQEVLMAVAGSTLNATKEVCAKVAAFAPEAEAQNLQSDIIAGGLDSQHSLVCT